MTILRKLYEFNIPREDLVLIYTMYIRSVLEYNSNVWFSAITSAEREDIERVQRVACKIILKGEYVNYNQSLKTLNLMSLSDRRQMLPERFAFNCSKSQMAWYRLMYAPSKSQLRREDMIREEMKRRETQQAAAAATTTS